MEIKKVNGVKKYLNKKGGIRMITTRMMSIDDYKSVYELWVSIPGMGLNDIDDSFDGIKRYLERNPDTSFVAEDDGKIVGAILAGHDGRRGFIYHAAVLHQYRNRGIGKKLVDLALNALKQKGISKVGLLVFSKNEIGNTFWEKMGFYEKEACIYRDKKLREMHYRPYPYLEKE